MTPQGQATNSLQDVLSQISGMAQGAQQDPSTAVSNQVTQAANTLAPANTQQVTNQLTQQSGIPQLQGDQQNLGQIFGMYLADQNLASKYASPQLTSGTPPVWNSGLQNNPQQAVSGNPNNPYSSIKDPYLASPAAIIQAIMGNQSYSGAQTPGQNTSAMTAVPSSAQSVIGSIGNLISSQQGLVNTGVQNYQTQYQNIMNTLNNALTQTSENAFSQATNQSTRPGTLANAGSTFNDIVNQVQTQKAGQATETDVWDYINQHQGALRDQGVNVNELWKLQKEQAQKVGRGGAIAGGKTADKSKSGLAFSKADLYSGFQKMKSAYQSAANNPLDPNAYNNYNTQKAVLSDILAYGLTKSRAWQTVKRMLDAMPDPRNLNPFDTQSRFGAEGAFTGFESQLKQADKQSPNDFSGSATSGGGTGGKNDPLGIL